MARSKIQQNSINLDPNREKLSVNMSVTPGDPTTQMNNPMNVTSFGPQPVSYTHLTLPTKA